MPNSIQRIKKMIVLLSPAKSLNEDEKKEGIPATQCQFLEDSQKLVDRAKKLSASEIKELMGVSEKIAELNYERFQNWHSEMKSSDDYQTLFLFQGDVYQGLEADSLNDEELRFLQKHLRILSGLYGYLRPFDLIKPYRLEMGLKFANEKGSNLYKFWQEKLTKSLREEGPTCIINLASNEYSKSINLKKIDVPVITPVFKDFKSDKYKVVSFWAKRARGAMVRFIAKNQITDVERLKDFNADGYYYSSEHSTSESPTFLRDHK